MKIGKDVTIHPSAKIIHPERITMGDSVIVDDFVLIYAGKICTIGSFVHIGASSSIGGGGELVMDDFSGLSMGVRVYTGNEDFSGESFTNPTVPDSYRKPIRSSVRIGKFAVLGANSVVLPGVTIGEGAVVGACSLVVRDCKPWTVYLGNPARPVRPRPSEKLLEMERQLREELYDAQGQYLPRSGPQAWPSVDRS